MLYKVRKKLRKDNGETIAEVLIAVLIIALGLVLLSSLVIASNNMMKKAQTKIENIYEGTNNIEMGIDSAEGVESASNKNFSIKSNLTNQSSYSVAVDIYKDTEAGLAAFQTHK